MAHRLLLFIIGMRTEASADNKQLRTKIVLSNETHFHLFAYANEQIVTSVAPKTQEK